MYSWFSLAIIPVQEEPKEITVVDSSRGKGRYSYDGVSRELVAVFAHGHLLFHGQKTPQEG